MTTEDACVEALREAAQRLGESPTKPQYEDLGLTPSASTILRVMDSWNEVKEAAGLSTNPSRGPRVAEKPADVDLPDGLAWVDLSQDQRWHYKNPEWNTERTLRRRAELRAWVNEMKAARGCSRCDESDPACLDFHHRDGDGKEMAITEMVTFGHSKANIREEFEKCTVLCANCHRKEHNSKPTVSDEVSRGSLTRRERLRLWSFDYRRSEGCLRCSEDDPVCLQFHHLDPEQKQDAVGNMISGGYTEAQILDEVEKCAVFCANCHRKEHFEAPDASGSIE